MKKTFKKHAHTALFFLGGMLMILLGQSLIPSSNAALTAVRFDNAITFGDATYVYAARDQIYAFDVTTPTNTVRARFTDPDGGISYMTARASVKMALTLGNRGSKADMAYDFMKRDSNIFQIDFLDARNRVLGKQLLAVITKADTFALAKQKLSSAVLAKSLDASHLVAGPALAYRDVRGDVLVLSVLKDELNRDIFTRDSKGFVLRDGTDRDITSTIAAYTFTYVRDGKNVVKKYPFVRDTALTFPNFRDTPMAFAFVDKGGKVISNRLSLQFVNETDFNRDVDNALNQYATLGDALNDALNLSLGLELNLGGYDTLSLRSLMTAEDVKAKIGTPVAIGEDLSKQIVYVRNVFDEWFKALGFNIEVLARALNEYRLNMSYEYNAREMKMRALEEKLNFMLENFDVKMKETVRARFNEIDDALAGQLGEEQKAYLQARDIAKTGINNHQAAK